MAEHQRQQRDAFWITIANHYAARSDPVSTHLLAQLCKAYQTRQLNDTNFYIGVYQHLYSTESLRLFSGFKSLLPPGWKDLELGWLNRQIEVEVEEKKERSRRAVGEVADGLMAVNEGDGSLATSPAGDFGAFAATAATGNQQKKKTPVKGFRTSYTNSKNETPPVLPSSSNTPTPLDLTDTIRKSPTKAKVQTPSSPHFPPSTPKLQAKLTTAKSTPQKPSPSPSSTAKTNNPATNLPTASSTPHFGPNYPTIRAILSRLATKPYIHSICGQHFGHPAEVKRHHDGQSGRPGCWEKSGKPKDKPWDEDKSCKIAMKDLEYVRVQEGWVVTSWGSVDVDGVKEGEEEGLVGGDDEGDGEGTEGLSGVSDSRAGGGKKRKMPATKPKKTKTSKPQPQLKQEEEEQSGEDSSDAGSDEDEDEDASFSDAELTPEPATKRRKVASTENEDGASDVNAAARAAALGLRARK